MAAKKTAKVTEQLARPWAAGATGGAFEAGEAAFGLRDVRPGFGTTPENDQLFALGYPHIVLLADEDVDLAGLAKDDSLHKKYYPWCGGAWPRNLVERMAPSFSVLANPELLGRAFGDTAPPVNAAELIRSAAMVSTPYGEVAVFMAEALLGSRAVLEGILTEWERIEAWSSHPSLSSPQAIPFILLRVDEPTRARALPRIAAIRDAVRTADAGSRTATGLSIAALDPPTTGVSLWTSRHRRVGDPELTQLVNELATLKPASRAAFDARLAFLGGEVVTAALANAYRGFHTTWRRAMVEQLARIAHPAARDALAALASAGDALAKRWKAEQ